MNGISSEKIFRLLITLSPLFLLTMANWINGIVFFASALSIYMLVKNRLNGITLFQEPKQQQMTMIFASVFILPLAAVFVAQCVRQEFEWRYYDSPSRFLLCVPILMVAVGNRFNLARLMNYTIPGSVFLSLAMVIISPEAKYGADRITTYFVDPLAFGSLNLMLGMLSLVSINAYGKESIAAVCYKISGFIVGMGLSVASGSRTGWLALPCVLFLYTFFYNSKYRAASKIVAILVPLVLSTSVYYAIPVVKNRVDLAVHEISLFRWNDVNPDTSVGLRISFYRTGLHLFVRKPFGGWGDTSFANFINTSEINKFTTQLSRDAVTGCGFHNELITNMVRSGIWGLIASGAIFLIPGIFFVRGLRSKSDSVRKLAVICICYLATVFVSGMTTEVFNLKYMASYHALMIACFGGSILVALYSRPRNVE